MVSLCVWGITHMVSWSALCTPGEILNHSQDLRPQKSTSTIRGPCLCPQALPSTPNPLGNLVGIHRPQTSKTIVVSLLTFFFLNAMTVFFFF